MRVRSKLVLVQCAKFVGIDATHNPEFTICEFYAAMFQLRDLMQMTEELFRTLSSFVKSDHVSEAGIDFETPFKVLDFVPAVEEVVQRQQPSWSFPDLSDTDSSTQNIIKLLLSLQKPLPQNPTLPRLVDALSEHFLEPQSDSPTFVTNFPECTSPLAKSFQLPPNKYGLRHRIAARAELFIDGREYVNCYEEENSPTEQRRKFEEQLLHREHIDGPETHSVVDESYLKALEWGMPPTGGWGCGVDRIVMLFAGKRRIADVLPFGSLRNVVGLGSHGNKTVADRHREP